MRRGWSFPARACSNSFAWTSGSVTIISASSRMRGTRVVVAPRFRPAGLLRTPFLNMLLLYPGNITNPVLAAFLEGNAAQPAEEVPPCEIPGSNRRLLGVRGHGLR